MGEWVGRVCEEEARPAARELHAMDVTEGETRVGVTGGWSVKREGGVSCRAGVGGFRGPEPPGRQIDEGTARWIVGIGRRLVAKC